MLTIEEIREKLEHMNLSAVARDSGVSYNTVHRLAKGANDISYKSVKLLSDWLNKRG